MPSAAQLSQLPTKFSGLRYLAFKSQVLTSTGITSLDSILGGGIPLGTVLLIEEDEYGVFTEVLMKYYYAEGIASNHSLFIASPDNRMKNIVYRLPDVVKSGEDESNENPSTDYKMKIAWRYQGDGEANSTPSRLTTSPNFGHNFDLTTCIPPQQIESADITLWPSDTDDCSSYEEVLQRVAAAVNSSTERILRIGLHSIGSACWSGCESYLSSLLYGLRSIVHNNTNTVLVISLPTHLIKSETVVKRCEDLSDTIICLESLANNSNPLYAEYKGLIKVTKYPCINSLAAHQPDASDWAFKLHRRKFVVEKLHIPPEIGSSEKKESSKSLSSNPLCHRPAANIDF